MDEETPVLDTLAAMTAVSIENSTLGARELMLARIAALAAMDAPAISYLMNVGAAADSGITVDDVQGVLIAVAPVIGTATAGAGAVSAAFTPPADNGGSSITSYTASCSSSDGGVTGSASGPSSPILVGSLTNGRTYTCSAFATNAVGDGSLSGESNAVVPTSVPGAPTIDSVTSSPSTATVAFTAPADDTRR